MKKLSFINKLLFLVNNMLALLLIVTYALPYIKPSSIATAPVIGLFTPALILANILFVGYWLLIGLKKQFLLSTVVLLAGYFISPVIYKLYGSDKETASDQLKILSYNVRKFNIYKWIDDENIAKEISDFIKKEDPDIVSLQEYKEHKDFNLDYTYSYHHINYNWNKTYSHPSGLAFFSKYPIINTGAVQYKKVFSSIIYIDILKHTDTVRIYNFHLESLGVNPDQEYFGHQDSESLVNRLKKSLKTQEVEIDTLNHHIKTHQYKTIVTGDMNNTAYSWAYKNLKNDFKDTFLRAGKGFGKTYDFKGFPLRIDYIFADKRFQVITHKNYTIKYSDHYPIMATLTDK